MLWVWTALFGLLGVMARATFIALAPRTDFPVMTFAINVFGSLLMGVVFGLSRRGDWTAMAPILEAIAMGGLGGFTTYSAYSLDILKMIENGMLVSALVYSLLTLLCAVVATAAGLKLISLL